MNNTTNLTELAAECARDWYTIADGRSMASKALLDQTAEHIVKHFQPHFDALAAEIAALEAHKRNCLSFDTTLAKAQERIAELERQLLECDTDWEHALAEHSEYEGDDSPIVTLHNEFNRRDREIAELRTRAETAESNNIALRSQRDALGRELEAAEAKLREAQKACSSVCEGCGKTICRSLEFDYRCVDCNKLFCLTCVKEHFVNYTFQNLTKTATEVAIALDHLRAFHQCIQHEMEQRICPKSPIAAAATREQKEATNEEC